MIVDKSKEVVMFVSSYNTYIDTRTKYNACDLDILLKYNIIYIVIILILKIDTPLRTLSQFCISFFVFSFVSIYNYIK